MSGSDATNHYGMPLLEELLSSASSEGTFQLEDQLPSLPVPPLKETLKKYLQSVRPLVTAEEFHRTEKIVEDFRNGIGKELNIQLEERAKQQRNWLEKWWEEYAYLRYRDPHAPFSNFASPAPYSLTVWPPREGTQLERAALITWYQLKHWEVLRKEKLRIDRGANGTVWSMYQFHRFYNGCKIPGETVDELLSYFKTEREGSVPHHLLVICKGRYFVFDALDRNGNILTAPELECQLTRITVSCENRPEGPGVGVLTGERRTNWYHLRKHLMNIHPENRQHLDAIEKSVFAVSLDDSSPATETEMSRESLLGNAKLRWFDKSLTCIVFRNGMAATNCDHAPCDGMVNSYSHYFVLSGLERSGYRWLGPKSVRELPLPVELDFHLDEKMYKAISAAEELYRKSSEAVELIKVQFEGFGKKFLSEHKLHPDTFVQMALQGGYYRLHHKPVPTYQTATTRKFFHGRTETIRACTAESVEWSRSIYDDAVSDSRRLQLLRSAIETHVRNMEEAKEGRGCDRHLFGLQTLSAENNLPTPDIFLDPSWTKSGGGGNFILSTSFLGYLPIFGSVTPMCKNGYGFFYAMESDKIHIIIDSWKADSETNAMELYSSVCDCLLRMKRLVETNSTARARL